jgi:hypothetical protein
LGVCGVEVQHRLTIAKIEVYNPHSDSSYHVSFENAQHLTRTKQAKWQGGKKIVLASDNRIKVTWAPRPSGFDGPIVMQVVA